MLIIINYFFLAYEKVAEMNRRMHLVTSHRLLHTALCRGLREELGTEQ